MTSDEIAEVVLDAQADLQTALGMYRLSNGRGDAIEDRLAKSLARSHALLEALGRPMYQPALHRDVPRLNQERRS
jgi:glycosyltransferase A (GT-A) superfamily protein (DUF2064 family)